uniref:Uncharacterized protein n=1 Tax=viral metagenome TaxID=1070528 RepID=A0A6C0ACR6_9ZZZZ
MSLVKSSLKSNIKTFHKFRKAVNFTNKQNRRLSDTKIVNWIGPGRGKIYHKYSLLYEDSFKLWLHWNMSKYGRKVAENYAKKLFVRASKKYKNWHSGWEGHMIWVSQLLDQHFHVPNEPIVIEESTDDNKTSYSCTVITNTCFHYK